ncbi:hypothetical protein chiPu_0019178 [Chiloscyllium punctatum]|uniref:Peptidase M14 domain-containing protein n=1 Tax=Chiloscyllium punctatum TaxID=137246 RepID=A0A401RQY9_CHIPU|nr:hypothetical protein [Chiloscyllium punctatum]
MISAWRKLWPEYVAGGDFEGFKEPPVVPVIVSLGKSMGLEMSEEDVEELVEDHKNELTTEELQHLHKTQQEEMGEEIFSEEEEELVGTFPVLKFRNCASCDYAAGTSCDWVADLGIDFTYVLEFRDNGTYNFVLPEDQIQPTCEETMAAVMIIIEHVLETYTADPQKDRFLQHIDFYVLPVLNIDGYIYSWTTDRLWRKSMSPCDNSSCFGTDLNRNFDSHWCSIGASRNCCSNTHCGSAPESEPETVAVATFLRDHLHDILCYLTIHSYGQLILTPYGYTNTTANNHEEMMRVGEKAADALERKHGTKFKVGPSSWILYYSSGSSRDWAGEVGIDFSYTFELRDNGTYQFLLPEDQIQPTCEETMAAVTTIIEHVHNKHFPNSSPTIVALWSGVLTPYLLSLYFVNSP